MSTYKILCVEDNSINMILMHHIFKRISHVELLEAETAELGIEIAIREQPIVIIMDIQLPGIHGYEALQYLQKHERTKHIPVIAVSSFAMKTDIEKGLNAGFKQYITKPINIKRFTQMIEQFISVNNEDMNI
ncbi:CheY-like chemotaxis protein [Paenibacillus sp. DS2015]|uniref:response regulator n=1 Tax=Paenibacillus sp. DS2015 TaxID=3373917 RepID=UPI003D24568F